MIWNTTLQHMGCVQNYDILLVDALTHYDTLMKYNITMFNAI